MPILGELPSETPPPTPGNLITTPEAKERLNITDSASDAHIDALLSGVSRMIEGYTGREFTLVAGEPTLREYWYDGGGILEIGDCTSVESVSANGRTLTDAEYILGPNDRLELVYTWIELAPLRHMSPMMGFTFNLDRLWRRHVGETKVAVTAAWGWPDDGDGNLYIPEDIKLAASWLISEGLDRTGATGVSSESIAEYAVSFAQGQAHQEALPERVTDILDRYRRVMGP